jgi:hypothetical protein
MSECLNLELTKEQRELLLDGLRFVRSARALDVRDPLPGEDLTRKAELSEVDELVGLLEKGPTSTVNA